MEITVDFRFTDGDKTGAMPGKEIFQKISLIRVISEHAGKVFADNAVYLSFFHMTKHLLESRPVIISSSGAVIRIAACDSEGFGKESFKIFLDDFFLVCDA